MQVSEPEYCLMDMQAWKLARSTLETQEFGGNSTLLKMGFQGA
jgi:hypothetical protein